MSTPLFWEYHQEKSWRVPIGNSDHTIWLEVLPFGDAEVRVDGVTVKEIHSLSVDTEISFQWKSHRLLLTRFMSMARGVPNKWGVSVDGVMVVDERITTKQWQVSAGRTPLFIELQLLPFWELKVKADGQLVLEAYNTPAFLGRTLTITHQGRLIILTKFATWSQKTENKWRVTVDNQVITDERR